MTLAPRSYPLSLSDALQELNDALGANYGAERDDVTLTRALSRDALVDGESVVHPRPWATAARLIRWNTEYEIGGSLNARIDRKLSDLEDQQAEADLTAGISDLIPKPDEYEAQARMSIYASSVLENQAVF